MIYIFNIKKVISYIIACSFVLILLSFHESIIYNNDIKLVKVSSNITECDFNCNIANFYNW